LSATAKYVFARHETFHPRFGWIKKGFDAASQDAEVFLREDAHIRLGVGKNMAQAIRYWCAAFKVTAASQTRDGRARGHVTTTFGRRLLADDGWDPWLEDPAPLWLLHWQLLKSPCQATAWRFVFDEFHSTEFTKDDLERALCDYRDALGLRLSDSSMEKDASCLLRMYVAQPQKKQVTEETLDCPFVELGLIQPTGESRRFAFRLGPKLNLPAAVIVAAALEYVTAVDPKQRTVSISSLTYNSGSPGLAFKLTESAICQAVEEVRDTSGGVSLADSAGIVQKSSARWKAY
jgi:catechol 2,3-dioxygenase-like lactoylglutathione lyase family enzyme